MLFLNMNLTFCYFFYFFLGQFKEILHRWFKKNMEMKKPASNQTLLVRRLKFSL